MRLPLRNVGFCFCLSEVIIIDIIFCISVPRLCSIRYFTPLEYAVASGLMLEPLARIGVERSEEAGLLMICPPFQRATERNGGRDKRMREAGAR